MDIQWAMSLYGFGHRETNHIIIDCGGELWIASAPVVTGGFMPVGAKNLPGHLRIEPMEDGAAVPFTYAATEALLELTTEKGARVKFVVDKDANALRITGNTALRLNGIKDSAGTSSLNTPAGVSLKIGGIRYLFAARKGKISFDDTFLLRKRHSAAPVLDIEPEDGVFELCAFHLPDDTPVPVITKTPEECAAENSAAFQAFVGSLVDVPSEWSDVKEKLAYPLWICHRVLEDGDGEVIVRNKYSSRETNAKLMSIASLAFKDAGRAVDMLLGCPPDLPPVAGVAAARLLADGQLNDSRGQIYRVYAALDAVARKCMDERTVVRDGLCFYAYRFESGERRSPAFFTVGEPVLAPDLNAYLVLVAEVLGQLANMEYDVGAGKKWASYARELKAKLVAELWDGEDFVGRNAYTGEASGPDKLLSLVPILLGSRLPEEILRKLAEKADEDLAESAVGLLVVGGLYDAGEKAAAKEIALKALDRVRSEAVTCPFRGAALLALAHKVL